MLINAAKCDLVMKLYNLGHPRIPVRPCSIKLSGTWKTTKVIWPGSLAFEICKASIHKLAKARGCFEGSRQYILSCEKTTPDKLQMRPFGEGNCYPQTWQNNPPHIHYIILNNSKLQMICSMWQSQW